MRHTQLRSLDVLSLERVLAKGPNVDHLKGQLLEELVESRLVPWLRTREGGFALGVTVPAGKKLEFIPGHLIRDTAGRQISDGMLVYRNSDELVVAAVFEAEKQARALPVNSPSSKSVSRRSPMRSGQNSGRMPRTSGGNSAPPQRLLESPMPKPLKMWKKNTPCLNWGGRFGVM